jgi:threonine dehydratase
VFGVSLSCMFTYVLVQVKIIGVEPSDANAMALSLCHGQRVVLEHVGGFADGVAVKVVGEETFRLCQELVDGIVLVSRDAICASIKVRMVNLFYVCSASLC